VLDAVLHVAISLLFCLRDVAETNQPPLATISSLAVRLRLGRQYIPMQGQRIEASGSCSPYRQHPHSVPTGDLGPSREGDSGDGYIEQGIGVRAQMQTCFAQIPPLVLERNGFIAGEQLGDDAGPVFQ